MFSSGGRHPAATVTGPRRQDRSDQAGSSVLLLLLNNEEKTTAFSKRQLGDFSPSYKEWWYNIPQVEVSVSSTVQQCPIIIC